MKDLTLTCRALRDACPELGAVCARGSSSLCVTLQVGRESGADNLALAGRAGLGALCQVMKKRVERFDRYGFHGLTVLPCRHKRNTLSVQQNLPRLNHNPPLAARGNRLVMRDQHQRGPQLAV